MATAPIWQARGVFFNEMPMRFYGSTPLAYSACFDQRDAVTRMVTGVRYSLVVFFETEPLDASLNPDRDPMRSDSPSPTPRPRGTAE